MTVLDGCTGLVAGMLAVAVSGAAILRHDMVIEPTDSLSAI
jgi:hypothetical protein